MIVAGVDVGSLTAKAVLMRDRNVIASVVQSVDASPLDSARNVFDRALIDADLRQEQVACCCSTGYGRLEVPFAQMNMSEISCHGLGAFWADDRVRTVVDIGGQDCKVIVVDDRGRALDFAMNDKCAAGTGRCLEIMAETLELTVSELGVLASKSHKPIEISNKCSIFMELEVLDCLYGKHKLKNIALGVCDAVARRVADLTASVETVPDLCVTGGVAKNKCVVDRLSDHMQMKARTLSVDPQLAGTIGAALFAERAAAGAQLLDPGPEEG